jgi:hypothetical protein
MNMAILKKETLDGRNHIFINDEEENNRKN